MKASAALTLTKAGQLRREKELAAQCKAHARAQKKQEAWELKVQLPKHMKAIYKAIKAACDTGRHATDWSADYLLETKTSDTIKARLERKGYKVEVSYRQGTSDMGDFNAPCLCEWSRTDFSVSWK